MIAVGGGQRVEREQRQRRRAVDQDVVVVRTQRRECGLEALLAPGFAHQADFGRGQLDVGRQQVEVLGGALEDLGRVGLAQQHVADRFLDLALVDAAAHGGIALRVEVDQQHALGRLRERGGQVDRGGGLADSAFLVGDSDDASHAADCLGLGLVRVFRPRGAGLEIMPLSRPRCGRDSCRRSNATAGAVQRRKGDAAHI